MGGANEMRMKQLPMLSYEVVISDQKFVIAVWRIFSQFQPPASLATVLYLQRFYPVLNDYIEVMVTFAGLVNSYSANNFVMQRISWAWQSFGFVKQRFLYGIFMILHQNIVSIME